MPTATLYVPENEAAAYQRLNPAAAVVPVPADVVGITHTRNWILDHVEDRHVVFVDDDLKAAGWVELLPFRIRYHKAMTEAAWLAEWARLFDVMEQMGYRVWGVATQSAPRAVYPYRPFIFHTYVTASCMGMVNDPGFRFDERFPVKEDYEICLRAIKEDGGILGARYLFWENDHWKQAGGCRDYRTQQMEESCIRRLIALYPGLIRRVVRGGSEYSIDLNF